MHNNIMIRGERGDHRELKPQFFYLNCPSCGTSRNCSHVKLFTTTARGLTCSKCKKSTPSTRWCCDHGTPWTRCPEHRETGFRCGSRNLPISKGLTSSLRQGSLKALKGRQAKLNKLGSLGEPKSLLLCAMNSVGSPSRKWTMVQKQVGKRRGKRPTPRREGGGGRLGELNKTPSRIGKEQHGNHDYTTNSIYWNAHQSNEHSKGGISKHDDRFSHPKNGNAFVGPHQPAKKARLRVPIFQQAKACRGNCPSVWTIDSFCESCHG